MIDTAKKESWITQDKKLIQTSGKSVWLWLVFVFTVSLAVALLHHFCFKHTKVAFIFDAVHYLGTCQNITGFLLSAAHGQWQPAVLTDRSFWEPLSLDGPVLTTTFALLFTLLGRVPLHYDWPVFVVGQTVLHSLSAALICFIVFGVTKRKSVSINTGLLWGLYPAAVIASGRFMTETLAAFLVLAFVASAVLSRRSLISAVIAGFSAGLLIMLKPAVVPSVVLAILWLLWSMPKQAILNRVAALVCVVLAVLPWALYSHAMTGKAAITVQRLPAYHLALGSDTETDAWGSPLLPPLTALISDSESQFAPVLAQWTYRPVEMSLIAIRKMYRLVANPWNDFRHSYFGLNASSQRVFHLVMVALAIFAMLTRLSMPWRSKRDNETDGALVLISILIFGQILSYLMVDPISRYAFTIIPLLFIFAGLCLQDLIKVSPVSLIKPRLWATTLIALLITAGIVYAEKLTSIGTSKEVEHKLWQGDKVNKLIDLSQSHLPRTVESALVMVDGDKRIATAKIEINGHKLRGGLISVYQLNSLSNGGYQLREQAVAMGLTADDLRQWRAAIVPYNWLKVKNSNYITVLPVEESTVYGDSDRHYRFIPSLDCYIIDKMCISTKSLDGRIVSPVMTGKIQEKSWISRGNSSLLPLTDSLRIKLALIAKPAESDRKSFSRSGEKQFERKIQSCDFDPLLSTVLIGGKWQQQPDLIRVNKYVVRAARSTECKVSLPKFMETTHLAVHFEGEIRCRKGSGDIGIPVGLVSRNGRTCLFNRMPTFVHADYNWRRFVLEDLMTTKTLGDRPQQLFVNLYPCPWQDACYGPDHASSDAQLRNLSVRLTAVNLADLAGKRVLIY